MAEGKETTISLTDVVNKLSDMGKIEGLYDIMNELKNISIEINSFIGQNTGSFVVANDFKLTELKIMGYFTDCVYYVMSADPQKLTLSEVFERFFSDANTFYKNALKCISNALNSLSDKINEALPEDDP